MEKYGVVSSVAVRVSHVRYGVPEAAGPVHVAQVRQTDTRGSATAAAAAADQGKERVGRVRRIPG